MDARSWWTKDWPTAGVRAMALSQSLPTAKTSEPGCDVVSVTEGAPVACPAEADAPTVVAAPDKATTVIEPSQAPDAKVAVTTAPDRTLGA